MLAEVAPAAPGAGFFFVGVFAFAALIVCIGLLRGIQYTLVPFLHWIARGLGHIPFAGGWLPCKQPFSSPGSTPHFRLPQSKSSGP